MLGAIVLTLPNKTYEVIEFKRLNFGLTPLNKTDFSSEIFTPREVADFFMLTSSSNSIGTNKRQHVFEQLSRNPQNAVFLTKTNNLFCIKSLLLLPFP